MKIDIAVAGTQKCVSVPSGLSLITYNQRVADYLAGRYQKELGLGADARNERFIQSNYLDLSQLEKYWGPERLNHHTEATTMIYGLHEGLRLLLQEGMENVYARHRKNNRILVESLQKMGLEIFGKLDTKHQQSFLWSFQKELMVKKCGAYYWIILKLKLPLPSVI